MTNATAKFCGGGSSTSSTTLPKCRRFTFTHKNKSTLTPNSRRRLCPHHRHPLCRRLRLPLRLALVEGGHWQLPIDQNGLSRGAPDAICSCPDGTPRAAWQTQPFPMPQREELFELERQRGVDPDVAFGRLCSYIDPEAFGRN
jgi:hypothetical protein